MCWLLENHAELAVVNIDLGRGDPKKCFEVCNAPVDTAPPSLRSPPPPPPPPPQALSSLTKFSTYTSSPPDSTGLPYLNVDIALRKSKFPPPCLRLLQVKWFEYVLKGYDVIGVLLSGFENYFFFTFYRTFFL